MNRFARPRDENQGQRATSLELFFDLVFVFAITQVSRLVLDDLSWAGVSHAVLALLVVWWAWNYTTWATDEFDPGSTVVRLLLIAVMLASLLLAVAIPEAFGSQALLFAGSYVAIQVGRHLFLTFAAASRASIERLRAARIMIWFLASGHLWIAGALVEGDARIALWVAALAIDYGAPLAVYRVPFMQPVGEDAWDVESSHFAERFQLFVIIALGETIVLTGVTTAELPLTSSRVTAFGLAFVGAAALWWLYFDYVAEIAERRLALAANRTRLARDGCTYLHAVIVAERIAAARRAARGEATPLERLSSARP